MERELPPLALEPTPEPQQPEQQPAEGFTPTNPTESLLGIPEQPEQPMLPDSKTLPDVQEQLKAQTPQELPEPNITKELWDKIKNTKGIPGLNLSPDEEKEAYRMGLKFFLDHVRDTLPPELRELANNLTPDDPETPPDIQQRLAMWQDITEPEKVHVPKQSPVEVSQDTPAMTIAPTQPPDSETLAGVRERLKKLQQMNQTEPTSE